MAKRYKDGGRAGLPSSSSITNYSSYPYGGVEGINDTEKGILNQEKKDSHNKKRKTGTMPDRF